MLRREPRWGKATPGSLLREATCGKAAPFSCSAADGSDACSPSAAAESDACCRWAPGSATSVG
eukprot:scaffold6622_cov50-Phaeocystis_antarctica.AAC.4